MNTTVPGERSTATPTPTELWFAMNSLVRDQARQSRDRISEVIDIPFSRFRALRRVAGGDLTQRELADKLGVDAPAASGIVNDLVDSGLVARRPHPTDGRAKMVTITDIGRRVVDTVVDDPKTAPPMFTALDAAQLRQLGELLETLRAAADA